MGTSQPDEEVARAIAAWRPRPEDRPAAAFARQMVGRVGPPSPQRARALLWSCSRLCAFGRSLGLPAEASVLFRPAVIERFASAGMDPASEARRRTTRANLRFVAKVVAPELVPAAPPPIPRGRARRPYSEREVEAYLRLADAQPTTARRLRCSALVCLGAGAGIIGADLRLLRGSQVTRRSDGVVVVNVSGLRPRVVPVVACFAGRVMEAADFAADGFIVGGVAPGRKNITNRLISDITGGADLGRLEPLRLRSHWLSRQASALGLRQLLYAAGITDSKHVFDVVSYLEEPDIDSVVSVLAGR